MDRLTDAGESLHRLTLFTLMSQKGNQLNLSEKNTVEICCPTNIRYSQEEEACAHVGLLGARPYVPVGFFQMLRAVDHYRKNKKNILKISYYKMCEV